MIKKILLLLVLSYVASYAIDKETIINNYLETRNIEAYKDVDGLTMAGFGDALNSNTPFNFYFKKPNYYRYEMPLKGLEHRSIIRDEGAWFKYMGKVYPLEDDQKERIEHIFSYIVGPLVDYNDNPDKYDVEFLTDTVYKDKKVYKLRVNEKDGYEKIHYFDSETFQIVASEHEIFFRKDNITTYIDYIEFKEVAGYKFAWKFDMNLTGIVDAFEMVKIEKNNKLTSADFRKPR